MKHSIYLDHAATTEISNSVKQYLISVLDDYGNPSSLYSLAEKPRQILSDAKRTVAAFLHADAEDFYFTPSGSASNTLAVKGLTSEHPVENQYEVFYSPTAHKSMLNACTSCICHTPLNVNCAGEIDLLYLDELLTKHNDLKPLVCIEAANSELGTINDVVRIGSIVHKHNGILVVDATGYIPYFRVDMRLWQNAADIITFSGHKLHALKGIGVLWKQKHIRLKPLIYGSQQHGIVAGTENVLGIASLGKAVEGYDYACISSRNRDYVYDFILHNIPDSYLIGASIASAKRLPHNLYMCFQGIEGESLMILLDMNGIQVSTGSACDSKTLSASAALSAIGVPEADIHSCIRMTFGGRETKEELDYVCGQLKACVESLRNQAAQYTRVLTTGHSNGERNVI